MLSDQLVARVERLERSHARMKRLATALGLLLAATFAGAMGEGEIPEVIRAYRFEVPGAERDRPEVSISSSYHVIRKSLNGEALRETHPAIEISGEGVFLNGREEGWSTRIGAGSIVTDTVVTKSVLVHPTFPGALFMESPTSVDPFAQTFVKIDCEYDGGNVSISDEAGNIRTLRAECK